MSEKNPKGDKTKDVESYIGYVQDIIGFQANNGLLTKAEADQLQKELDDASTSLGTDPIAANSTARRAFYELVDRLNAKPRSARLIYMYGLHIWIFLILLTLVLFILLLKQTLNFSIFGDVPMDAIVWGGLGGCGYSIFHLRKNVYGFELSKYYAVYWFVYPVAGMIFGLAITFAVSSGLLSLQAKPSYGVYATIAFLGGTFQQWVLGTLKDIAESIHAPKGPP